MTNTAAIATLLDLRDSLPVGHHDRPGVLRSIEVLGGSARTRSPIPLRFVTGAPGSGMHQATDVNGTGLTFVMTRVEYSDGDPGYLIEVFAGGNLEQAARRVNGIRRYDSAKAWCNEYVRKRLTGEDR